MLTKGKATFILVIVGVVFLCPGNSDVTITAKNRQYVTMSFPADMYLFNKFHSCLCDVHKRCTAIYNRKNVCKDVNEFKNESRHRAYYRCFKRQKTVRCSLQDSDPSGVVRQEIKCRASTVTLYWTTVSEGIIFDNHDLCQKYCRAGCKCPVAKTTVTPSTTTTATSSSKRNISPTCVSAATNSASAATVCASASSTHASAGPTSASETEDDVPLGVIIGVVVLIILFLIIITVIGVFVWKRRRNQNTPEAQDRTTSFTGTQQFNNVSSSQQNIINSLGSDSLYTLPFPSSDYSNAKESKGAVPFNTAVCYTNVVNDSTVNEPKTDMDPTNEYAVPEDSHNTFTNNEAAQLNDNNVSTVSTNLCRLAGSAESSSTSVSGDKSIYSRLHEENRQMQNLYNTLLESNEEA